MRNCFYVGFYWFLLVLPSLALATTVAASRKQLEHHALRAAPVNTTNGSLRPTVERSQQRISSRSIKFQKTSLTKMDVSKRRKANPKRVKARDAHSLEKRTLVDYVDYPAARTHPPTEPPRK